MSTLSYKGYSGTVEYSAEDACLFGLLIGINASISYEGDSVETLRASFKEAVDDYLETCKTLGKEPDKPYSGRFLMRIEPALHAKLAMQARIHGKSLNQYAADVLAQA